MKKIIKTIIYSIMAGAMIALLLYAAEKGIEGQERFECLKWQQQAREYRGFYLTKWQAEQCQARGVKIQAPIY